MSYLLDTTVVIDWVADHAAAVEVVERLFAETDQLFTCDVVTCEALSGGTAVERRAIDRFLGALEYVAVDPEGAAAAGDLRRATGRTSARGLGDALIAALALRLGATVVTRNPRDYGAFDVRVLGYGAPLTSAPDL